MAKLKDKAKNIMENADDKAHELKGKMEEKIDRHKKS